MVDAIVKDRKGHEQREEGHGEMAIEPVAVLPPA